MSSNPYNIDVYKAKDALADLEVEVRARLSEAEKQIRADMHDTFEAAKSALAAATDRRDAEQAVLDAKAAVEASTDDRIGRIYVEWKPKYQFSRELALSGNRGVCEVFTAEMRETSAHPSRHPEPGRLIVRHLKKNGERAKTFEVFNADWSDRSKHKPPWGWYLEGENPESP